MTSTLEKSSGNRRIILELEKIISVYLTRIITMNIQFRVVHLNH